MNRFIKQLVFAVLTLVWAGTAAQEKGSSTPNQMPKKVTDALTAKFSMAEVDKWTKEEEGGSLVYDIEFKQDGLKFEADIFGDGTIHNWEKAITTKDLPAAVTKTVEKKYPKAVIKEIMAVTAVNKGKEEIEGYEIVLEKSKNEEVEVTVAPDGTILEDPGDEKKSRP